MVLFLKQRAKLMKHIYLLIKINEQARMNICKKKETKKHIKWLINCVFFKMQTCNLLPPQSVLVHQLFPSWLLTVCNTYLELKFCLSAAQLRCVLHNLKVCIENM